MKPRSVPEVLVTLHAAGLQVALTPDSNLLLKPSSLLTNELRAMACAHKAAMVA